ncbi:MAG: hypothetical protein C4584_02705 [Armatimonadetes bacterium]|nr:MAG: hypothetical protein C4584_02705 [Armatimonadota bacterium]
MNPGRLAGRLNLQKKHFLLKDLAFENFYNFLGKITGIPAYWFCIFSGVCQGVSLARVWQKAVKTPLRVKLRGVVFLSDDRGIIAGYLSVLSSRSRNLSFSCPPVKVSMILRITIIRRMKRMSGTMVIFSASVVSSIVFSF